MANKTISLNIDAETQAKIDKETRRYELEIAKLEGARETYRLAHEILQDLASQLDKQKKFYSTKSKETEHEEVSASSEGAAYGFRIALGYVKEAIQELYERA